MDNNTEGHEKENRSKGLLKYILKEPSICYMLKKYTIRCVSHEEAFISLGTVSSPTWKETLISLSPVKARCGKRFALSNFQSKI